MADATVWVLADDRPGNVAQCLGVAEALGEPFRTFNVRYDKRAEWHNLFRYSSLIGLTPDCIADLTPPWPKLVVAAGRRTAPLAQWLKRKHGAKLVQIMDPGWPVRGSFDLIAAPKHDEMRGFANVIRTVGSCHRAVPALLEAERAKWEPKLAHLPRPWLMLSVGGATKDYEFGTERARQLMDETKALAARMGASLLVTSSRRTGAEIDAVIAANLPENSFFFPWQDGIENPYLGMVGAADAIVATGDSMNMCSEACANGCPVYIFCPPGMVNEKHARLHDMLFEAGFARPLDPQADLTPWTHPSLNAAIDVAKEVRRRGLL